MCNITDEEFNAIRTTVEYAITEKLESKYADLAFNFESLKIKYKKLNTKYKKLKIDNNKLKKYYCSI